VKLEDIFSEAPQTWAGCMDIHRWLEVEAGTDQTCKRSGRCDLFVSDEALAVRFVLRVDANLSNGATVILTAHGKLVGTDIAQLKKQASEAMMAKLDEMEARVGALRSNGG
jgi:ATP-dependent exoDNAse (exonuclease V) alpha subunit